MGRNDDAVNDDAREPEAAAPQPDARELGAADFADLLAGLTAVPSAEPTPEQVSALFAVALDGEPPSTVTAESVLREVRAAETARPARFLSAEWFAEHTTAWKWGGGLVAAAAVVGTVVVTVPGMGGDSAAGSAMLVTASAEAQADSALNDAAGAGDSAASKDGMEESSSSAESYQLAAPDQPMAAMDSAEAPAEGVMSPESASEPAGDDAGGAAQSSEGYSADGDTSSGTADGLGSGRQLCPMAPLLSGEVTVVKDVLADLVAREGSLGGYCDGTERGSSFLLTAPDAAVDVTLAPAAPDDPTTPGEFSAMTTDTGSIKVSGRTASWVVLVDANAAAAKLVDGGILTFLAKTVLAAAG